MVTGGTGFVGSHAVAALRRAGHDVRLLVRTPAKIGTVLAPHGLTADDVDHRVGDVTDRASVAAALDGCDAVIHAAAAVSLHVRDADEVLEVNRTSAEVVLAQAVERGLDPVIHVSSIAALQLPPEGGAVSPDSPVVTEGTTYARSKAAAELVARRLQADGKPVVTVYPTGVLGPHDPNLGELTTAWRNLLRSMVPALPPGGYYVIDVRDLADALVAMLVPGRGPRRYLISGHHVTTVESVAALSRATGRTFRVPTLPTRLAAAGGRLADAVQRVLPVRLPFGYEAVATLTLDPRCDDTRAREELHHTPRPLTDSVADTVRWMMDAGLITTTQAGDVAGT
jgi:nucleoside-diphosphate-sugar epimerase